MKIERWKITTHEPPEELPRECLVVETESEDSGVCIVGSVNNQEAQEVAALIAAAPDLLIELEAMMSVFGHKYSRSATVQKLITKAKSL